MVVLVIHLKTYGTRSTGMVHLHIEVTIQIFYIRGAITLGRKRLHEIGILPDIALAKGIATKGCLLGTCSGTIVGGVGSGDTVFYEYGIRLR